MSPSRANTGVIYGTVRKDLKQAAQSGQVAVTAKDLPEFASAVKNTARSVADVPAAAVGDTVKLSVRMRPYCMRF